MKYVIGTRGSKLALAQTEVVCGRLREAYPEHEFEIRVIQTKGDKIQNKPLNQMGGTGVFVREIEKKILAGEVQIGVHSMKDMPAVPSDGLGFSKIWKREDPRDVLVLREADSLNHLPSGAVIATGSIRREIQLKRMRPDIHVVGIRGNVDTRLQKMEEQKLDGIVLAAAGLHRLGLKDRITEYLAPEQMIPAPAQGALALEIREDDSAIREMLDALCDRETDETVHAERSFLQKTGVGCHVPVGAFCEKQDSGEYRLRALFGNETCSRMESVIVTGRESEVLADQAWTQICTKLAGTVTLVGGGPGDPELITVKGRRAIREADCIIYDRLSSPLLLGEAKEDCEFIYVGKEENHHTVSQEEINRILIQKSLQYEKTVRLKGGDAYVFGRGGEEALALFKRGIPFEVIPGISSVMAGPASVGIPLTHRGIASGFHVVTAHSRSGGLAHIDFAAMARGDETCVFVMGLRVIRELADRLIDAGMAPDTPAAVISGATTGSQKVCISELQSIAAEAMRAELQSPALIVVGEVVNLSEQLNSYGRQRLSGKRFLIPKIGTSISRLAKLLREKGAYVDEITMGKIVKRELTLTKADISGVDWFVFTSRHGVEAFWENLLRSGLDSRTLSGSRIAVIGEKTGKCLQKYGIRADVVSDGTGSAALAERLTEYLTGQETVWQPGAGDGGHELQKLLGDKCYFREVPVYDNEPIEGMELYPQSLSDYDGILFTCGSLAERFLKVYGEEFRTYGTGHPIFSIGPRTTAVLQKCGIANVKESQCASYDSLAADIETFFQ